MTGLTQERRDRIRRCAALDPNLQVFSNGFVASLLDALEAAEARAITAEQIAADGARTNLRLILERDALQAQIDEALRLLPDIATATYEAMSWAGWVRAALTDPGAA